MWGTLFIALTFHHFSSRHVSSGGCEKHEIVAGLETSSSTDEMSERGHVSMCVRVCVPCLRCCCCCFSRNGAHMRCAPSDPLDGALQPCSELGLGPLGMHRLDGPNDLRKRIEAVCDRIKSLEKRGSTRAAALAQHLGVADQHVLAEVAESGVCRRDLGL